MVVLSEVKIPTLGFLLGWLVGQPEATVSSRLQRQQR